MEWKTEITGLFDFLKTFFLGIKEFP